MQQTTYPSFWALPSLAVLFFIASAVCLIGGAGLILAPLFDEHEFRPEAYVLTGALQLYEFALLGVAVVLARYKAAAHDVESLLVLMAMFFVTSCVSLDVIAARHPGHAAAIAVVFAVLGLSKWWYVQRCLTGPFALVSSLALAVLLLMNMGAPVVIGWLTQAGHGPQGTPALVWMVAAALVVIAAVVLLAGVSGLDEQAWRGERRASGFIAHPLMRRIAVLLIVVFSIAHLYLLAFTMDLSISVMDFALHGVVLAMLGLAASRALGWYSHAALLCWCGAAVAVPFACLITGSFAPLAVAAHPVPAILFAALGVWWCSLRWGDLRLRRYAVVMAWLGLAHLMVQPTGYTPNRDVIAVGLIVAAAVQVWRERNAASLQWLCLALGAAICFAPCGGWLETAAFRDRLVFSVSLLTLPALMALIFFRDPVSDQTLLQNGIACSLGFSFWTVLPGAELWRDGVVVCLLLVVAGLAFWRSRRPHALSPLAAPVIWCAALLRFAPVGWILVIAAFALLAAGAGASWWQPWRRRRVPLRAVARVQAAQLPPQADDIGPPVH